MVTRAATVLVVGLASAASAHADERTGPDVDVARCTSLDRAAVARTVGTELANLGPEVRRALARHVLLVDCPDAVTANLRVEPAVAGVPVTRSIDLTDLPAEFRVRLVALAGAELLESIAAALPTAPAEATGGRPAGASAPTDPDDPTSMRDRGTPPPVAPRPVAATPQLEPRHQRDETTSRGQGLVARPRAALLRLGPDHRAARRVGVSARLGLRTYRATLPVMLEGTVEVALGPIVIGALGATVDRAVAFGNLQAHLVAGSLGVTTACRAGWLSVCAGARGAAGVIHVTGDAAVSDLMPGVTVASRTAPYVQGSGWLEVGRDVGGVAAVIVIETGYATGVIARGGPAATSADGAATGATTANEVAVAGLLGTLSVGARW